MSDAFEQADVRFTHLWEEAQHDWLSRELTPAKMNMGTTDPVDFCLSTIGRCIHQPHAPLSAILHIQEELRSVSPTQFFYPVGSLHVSLLGCTPRFPAETAFTDERRQRILSICKRELPGKGSTNLSLRGVGIIGNQVFIQVFPHDNSWAVLRQALDDALMAAGEQPHSYPDKAPIHLNIMRMTRVGVGIQAALLSAVRDLRNVELGHLTVSVIDYVLTDFVVSPTHSEILCEINLSSP